MALVPAYGRDYKNIKEVTEAYLGGADFVLNDISSRWDGAYCSGRDFVGESVEIRYAKKTKVVYLTFPR
jgi:hypothetical protein